MTTETTMLGDDLLDLLWVKPDDLTAEERARLDAAEAELRRVRPDLFERPRTAPVTRLVKVLRRDN
jgi:hypothetical protein